MREKYLFLQCRNLGDAIISTGLINSLGKNFPNISIDIFTKYPFKAVFENNPYINCIFYANFPTGSPKGLGVRNYLALLKQIYKLREKNYDVCLNREGDFRENFIGRLVNPCKNISVLWEGKHVYNNLIRKGLSGLLDEVINIPEEIINIYDANDYVAKKLGCTYLVPPRIFLDKKLATKSSLQDKNIVGVHPCASQKSKLWDFDKWQRLIEALVAQEFEVCIFCAPNQKTKMQSIFREVIDNKNVLLQALNLNEFFIKLSLTKFLIGLDSFSVHAAYALGIPVIMLNGANDYRIFRPPAANMVAKENVCPYHPCYNKPKCIGSEFEYTCINSIEVNDVLTAIEELKYCS